MRDEEITVVELVGAGVRVTRFTSRARSFASLQSSGTLPEKLAQRLHPDVIVWRTGDSRGRDFAMATCAAGRALEGAGPGPVAVEVPGAGDLSLAQLLALCVRGHQPEQLREVEVPQLLRAEPEPLESAAPEAPEPIIQEAAAAQPTEAAEAAPEQEAPVPEEVPLTPEQVPEEEPLPAPQVPQEAAPPPEVVPEPAAKAPESSDTQRARRLAQLLAERTRRDVTRGKATDAEAPPERLRPRPSMRATA